MWTTAEKERLTKYMDGEYADICEWSAYTTTPESFRLPYPGWTPDAVSEADKELVAKLHSLIDGQEVSSRPLYRFERAYLNESLYTDAKAGDIIKLPIRSASRVDLMAKIDRQEGVNGLEKDDYYSNPNGNDYRFIEYRFLTSKSVDISDMAPSDYSDQEEELVAGTYRIAKVDYKAKRYMEFEETRTSYADLIKREGLTVERRISKKGNEIVAFEYKGKPLTCPADKMESTFIVETRQLPNQLERTVLYLEII